MVRCEIAICWGHGCDAETVSRCFGIKPLVALDTGYGIGDNASRKCYSNVIHGIHTRMEYHPMQIIFIFHPMSCVVNVTAA